MSSRISGGEDTHFGGGGGSRILEGERRAERAVGPRFGGWQKRIGGKEDRPHCPSVGARPVQLTRGLAYPSRSEVADVRRSAQAPGVNSVKTWPSCNGSGKAPSRWA